MIGVPRTGHSIAGAPTLNIDREYDSQLSHTIWEMERAVRRGPTTEPFRRILVETHAQHIRHLEEMAQMPRHQRTQLRLQPRPAESLLLLAAENMTADELEPLAEAFHKRGFAVMNANLAFRSLEKPGHSPIYWQTCADEATNRFDVLAHYATSVAIVGVGLSGLVGLHVATVRRVAQVVALFPTFDGDPGLMERLRGVVRRLLRKEEAPPHTWPEQRKEAARAARATLERIAVPLYVLSEDRGDRSESGRSTQAARKLVHRAATKVRLLRAGEAASVRDLPPAAFDEILGFLRRR